MRVYVIPSERPDGDGHRCCIVGPRAEIYNVTEGQAADLAIQILANHGRYTITDAMTGEDVTARAARRTRTPRRRASARDRLGIPPASPMGEVEADPFAEGDPPVFSPPQPWQRRAIRANSSVSQAIDALEAVVAGGVTVGSNTFINTISSPNAPTIIWHEDDPAV